jgi:hypothetical protein
MKILPKVTTEMALHLLAYNLMRPIKSSVSSRPSRQSGREERSLFCASHDHFGLRLIFGQDHKAHCLSDHDARGNHRRCRPVAKGASSIFLLAWSQAYLLLDP